MSKQSLFKFIDLVIYFNVIMFLIVGVNALAINRVATVFSFFIAFVNVLYLMSVIKMRVKYNKEFF